MIDTLFEDDGIWGYTDNCTDFQLLDNPVKEYKESTKVIKFIDYFQNIIYID